MSNRLAVAVALSVLVSTSACSASRTLMVTGAVTTGLGAVMIGGVGHGPSGCTGSDSVCSGYDSLVYEPVADTADGIQMGLGGAVVLGGLAMLVAGMIIHPGADDEQVPAIPQHRIAERNATEAAPAPTSPVAFAPAQRSVGAPGSIVEHTASPAEMAIRSRIENRLAIQASFTARRGDCIAAVATSTRLAEVDPAMHAELVRTDADLARCIALAAATQN